MTAMTLDYQQCQARNGPRPVNSLAYYAIVALILTSAALGSIVQHTLIQHTLIHHTHAPAVTVTTSRQSGGLRRCRATGPDTHIVTLPYLYPTNHCPRPVVLDRSEHLRPDPQVEATHPTLL